MWRWPIATDFWVRVTQPDFVLKAGEYRLPANASPAEILAIFDSGVSVQYKVTLIEGDNAAQMLGRLQDNSQLFGSVESDSQTQPPVLADLLSDTALAHMGETLASHPNRAEGWFLPDTYFLSKGDSIQAVLARSHSAMIEALDQEWQQRDADLPYQNPYQALVMASLIEKETGVAYERSQIAGVFVRRLQKRMRLQTDPTVIYGMGAAYEGNLRRADLKADNEYNTYTRSGLPPTPIAMPGRAAIHAALHPLPGTTLYFVAKGDGSHHFSTTLEEHRAAVQKYQIRQRRADYRSSPKG